MTTDELRISIGVQVEKGDKWTDEYVLALEAKCMALMEKEKKGNPQPHPLDSEKLFYWFI